MNYPCLIPAQFCTTDIHFEIEQEGLNKYGEPLDTIIIDTKCNYQDSAKTILTADKKLVQLSGIAQMPGDICPDLPAISGGSAVVFGVKRRIFQGLKARNPDGTVNYTEVRLE